MEAYSSMTALPHELLAGLFVGQFILAGVGVLISYKLIEINWTLGFIGSIGLGAAILAAQVYIGDILWDPGLNGAELQEVVVATVAGAVLAIMIVVTLFKPDISQGSESAANQLQRSGTTQSNETPDIPGGLGED